MDNSVDLIDWLGEDLSLALGGLVIGALFGFFAQRSRFCLRAAVVEVARAQAGAKLSVWLLAFSSALILTQTMILLGAFDTANVRQLSSQGSVSGSLIGGLLFGIGMVLARGCSSRLLVLAANPKSVEEFRSGKEKAFNALVGQVMKASKGKASPGQVNALLRKKLEA